MTRFASLPTPLALLAATACTEQPPTESQSARDVLVSIAQQSPDLTLRAETPFDGMSATVSYTIDGQVSQQALTGYASADFTLIGDDFYLTRFDTRVDDLTITVAPLPGVTTQVAIADTQLRLSPATPHPLITLADVGPNMLDASVMPVLDGEAEISIPGYTLSYERTEALGQPVIAALAIGDDAVDVSMSYSYSIAITQPVPATAQLAIAYTTTFPRGLAPGL